MTQNMLGLNAIRDVICSNGPRPVAQVDSSTCEHLGPSLQ